MLKVLFTFMHVADEATYSVLDTNWEHNLCTSNNIIFVKKVFRLELNQYYTSLKCIKTIRATAIFSYFPMCSLLMKAVMKG